MIITNHQRQPVRAVNVLIVYQDEVQNDLIIIKIIAAQTYIRHTHTKSCINLINNRDRLMKYFKMSNRT